MATRTLATITLNGFEYRITMENRLANPYRITRKWWAGTDEKHISPWRTETVERYGDYQSCLYWIAQEANLYGKNHITG